MARVYSPIELRGTLGDLVFSRSVSGTKRAYLNPMHNRKEWLRKHPDSLPVKTNRAFAAAVKMGSGIYKALLEGTGPIARPYAHNVLSKRIYQDIHQQGKWMDKTLGFDLVLPAVLGTDLSHKGAPTRHLSTTPIGPRHAPTEIHIHGLHKAAQAIGGIQDLECRIILQRVSSPKLVTGSDNQWEDPLDRLNTANHKTQWFPAHLLPAQGIRLPVPQCSQDIPSVPENPGYVREWTNRQPALIGLAVEWRRVRHMRKPKRLHNQAILRIVAASIPDHCLPSIAPASHSLLQVLASPRPTRRYRLQPPAIRKPKPQLSPQKQLAMALGHPQRQ